MSKLSTIEAWLQSQDDELLYDPDGIGCASITTPIISCTFGGPRGMSELQRQRLLNRELLQVETIYNFVTGEVCTSEVPSPPLGSIDENS